MAGPANHLLQVDDLTFGYGADRLFEGVAFSLSSGDRMALVAPNGAGKSTLLRLLAGELPPDGGRVVRRKDATVGYYRQSHELDATAAERDVMDAFLSGFEDVVRLRHELAAARDKLGHAADGAAADASLSHMAKLEDAYHLAHGDDLERKIEILAQKLGFGENDLARKVASLSGGERGRLLLGTVLAKEPELLLLDEPTNHLDIDTITWLEEHLRAYRGGVLVVSHDRRFLDRVTTATAELGSRSFRQYAVPYGQYVVQREEELGRERALVERQQAFVDKTQDFIRKNIAGQKTKQAQSRRKMLDKLDKLERPEDIWAEASKLRVRFAPAARSGDIVLDCKGLSAERGGRTLFTGVDLLVRRGDRIGVVGPNGAGKSTLLKLLAGKGDPLDRGTVRRGTNLQDGYFDQHLGELDPKKTAVEEVRSVRGDLNVDGARQYLARFRITGDDALRSVSGFSGGERSRLALAKLLLEPRNFLYLDEPTNHLDIPACEILEHALAEGFDGTLILVSHDRQFLENVTTRLIVVRDGSAQVLPGGFRDHPGVGSAPREKRSAAPPPRAAKPRSSPAGEDDASLRRQAADLGISWQASAPPSAASKAGGQGAAAREASLETADGKRREFEDRRVAARDVERKKRRVAELETSIAALEVQLAALRAGLLEDPKGDWAALASTAERERAASRTLDAMVEEWTRLSEQLQGADGGAKVGA